MRKLTHSEDSTYESSKVCLLFLQRTFLGHTMTSDEQPAKRRNVSRGISRNTVTQRHPLNVKPSGNALIFSDSKLKKQRRDELGVFQDFSDDMLLDVLSYVTDPKDLMNLGHCSRIWYAFLYDEEMWRKLYISKALKEEATLQERAPTPPLGITQWQGSWRRTMLGVPESKEAKIQLPDNLLCSDTLFRPYQCSQVDYNELLKDIIDEEEESYKLQRTLNTKFGIPRFTEENMTVQKFESSYTDKPFMISHSHEDRWPEWTLPQLKERFPEVKFRQESVQWPLGFYSQYFAINCDESPLYLFDCQSSAMKQLVKEYHVPQIFSNDIFTLFNEQGCRPDYRWIIVGPTRSGSTFHKDPNATSAWNANLSGRKLWVMLPPGVKPPGVGTDEEESEVTSPVGIAEWVLSGFYNDSVKLALEGKCQIGITFPGECMYVPNGWWHSVINLEDSVALTQNFVPKSALGDALWFLKGKREQVSGFHVKDLKRSIEKFVTENELEGENKEVLVKWLRDIEEQELDNEDVGECSSMPELPIFEFFLELVKQKEQYKELLGISLGHMETLEKEHIKKNKKVVASKKWDQLVQQDDTSSGGLFSFNFDESDDDE